MDFPTQERRDNVKKFLKDFYEWYNTELKPVVENYESETEGLEYQSLQLSTYLFAARQEGMSIFGFPHAPNFLASLNSLNERIKEGDLENIANTLKNADAYGNQMMMRFEIEDKKKE